MAKTTVVALSGKMRSGKSFVANHLIEHHGFQRLTFAGPLKDDIRAMGFPEWAVQQKPDWMRLLMQVYGQAWRAIDPDHWVNQLLIDLRNASIDVQGDLLAGTNAERRFVIDDLRFRNEAQALREWETQTKDVKLIRLYRLGDPGKVAFTEDISETGLDHWENWDAIVQAVSGDLPGLCQGVERALNLPHRR